MMRCDHARSATQGAKLVGRRDSGYDCGDAYNCIQADGSGYYVPSKAKLGPEQQSGHNFYINTSVAEERALNRLPEGMRGSHLNAHFSNSAEAWCLRASFDWLASTARRRLAP